MLLDGTRPMVSCCRPPTLKRLWCSHPSFTGDFRCRPPLSSVVFFISMGLSWSTSTPVPFFKFLPSFIFVRLFSVFIPTSHCSTIFLRSDECGWGSQPATSLEQECPVYWPSHENIFERLALEVVLYRQSASLLAFI